MLGVLTVLAVFGASVGIASAIASNQNQQKQLTLEEKEQKIDAYKNGVDIANTSYTEILNYLGQIDNLQATIDSNQSLIDTNSEWLENYQSMLSGDRDNTELGRELASLEASRDMYKERTGLLQQAQQLAIDNAQTYLTTSAVEKSNTYNSAFDEYTSMLKNQSLLNVAAGANGGKSSAYSMASLMQQQQLRNYVGVDMTFNTADSFGESEQSDGSFLRSYVALQDSINAQIEQYDYQIEQAKLNISDNEKYIKSAENSIKDFYSGYETQSKTYETQIEDAKAALERDKQTLEDWKTAIKQRQTTALAALKTARTSAEEGGEEVGDISVVEGYEKDFEELNKRLKEEGIAE